MSCRDCDLAWAGGLFEGEGCIYLSESGVRLVVRMTDEDVVRRFWSIVAVGNVTGPYHNTDHSAKLIYSWTCLSHDLSLELLKRLEPWLGERRCSKYREVVAETSTWKRGPGSRKKRAAARLIPLPVTGNQGCATL